MMWRFKTEAEFLEEYRQHWRYGIGWDDGMDRLFGLMLLDDEVKGIQESSRYRRNYSFRILYSVNEHMITDKSLPISATPDFIPGATHRFKTEEEFIQEYGKEWEYEIGWNREGKMDYLFGLPIDPILSEKLLEGEWLSEQCYPEKTTGHNYWGIDLKMITPLTKSNNQPLTQNKNVTRNSIAIEVQPIDFTIPVRRRITGSPIYY